MLKIPSIVLATLALASHANTLGAIPRIFFSDLDSGPKSGGQNNAGVFVTIYGARFGTARAMSYVTVGGGKVASYPLWSNTKVTFQLGPNTTTGDIVITTSGGASNGIPFTIRSGKIYFISPTGKDGNSGSYASPWKTFLKARDAMQAGDTTYVMNGTAQLADDGQGWRAAILLREGGKPGLPKAIVAYPAATATVGDATGPPFGIRTNGTSYFTVAGLVLRGHSAAIVLGGPASNWRIIGNDVSCPEGDGEVGCLGTSQVSNIKVLGNNIHNAGAAGASSHYHGVYLSTDSNHTEFAWNIVANIRGCRGIQVYSSPLGSGGASDPTGRNMFDLSFHDNLLHDTQCDGILLATVDPSQGKVEVFNNVIYNAGTGPNNPERTGAWTCVNAPGTTANGSAGGGTIEVFNNTLYNCGSFASPPYSNANAAIENGGNNSRLVMRLRNNIVYQTTSAPYLVSYGSSAGITGDRNLFFGNTSTSSYRTLNRSLASDPQFIDPANHDFHLRPSSPARAVGVDTGASLDFDGQLRGNGTAYDLGALRFVGTEITSLVCTPAVIWPLGSSTCTATINQAAPNNGIQVATSTDSTELLAPPGVVIEPGALNAVFTVQAKSVDQRVNAAVSASVDGSEQAQQVLLLPSNDSSPALVAVLDAASLRAGPVAPGGIVSGFGSGLGPPSGIAASPVSGKYQTNLAGVGAYFDDIPAPLLYVGSNQVNAVVPFSVAGRGDVRFEVEVGGVRSNAIALSVVAASPVVFTMNASGAGHAVAINEDGTLNSGTHPAAKNSFVTLYAAGLGLLSWDVEDGQVIPNIQMPSAAPVLASVANSNADVQFAGAAPGFIAGLYQVNVRIPADCPSGADIPIVLHTQGAHSQAGVTLTVE